MITKTIENLETYLTERGSNKTLILLSAEDCHACDEFKAHLESVESTFSTIQFVEVEVTIETKPLFGPPVLPSMVGFENSQRVLEGAGMPEDLTVANNLLQSWVDGAGFQYSAG
jgi:hypothetical protein